MTVEQQRPIEIAQRLVDKARAAGADQADAVVVAGTENSVQVRMRAVEKLLEAGSRSVGLRAIVGGRQAVVSTADLSEAALDEAVRDVIALAAISEPDEHAGLPDPADQASGQDSLQIYDEAIEALAPGERIERALACEAAALDADPRISNSGGASFSTTVAEVALADSNGFGGSYLSSTAMLGVEVMAAEEDGGLRNDYWCSAARSLHRLEAAEEVGRQAAARTLRQLGAGKCATQVVPVVWEPRMAASLVATIGRAASGEAFYRRSTFLADAEGQAVAGEHVTLVDDATLPARLASMPFDGDGIATRRNPLIDRGVFRGFLFDTYNARRTGRRSTGSAVRDVGTLPSVGTSNLALEAGSSTAAEIIAGVVEGLYLTTLMGFGINLTTGDFSRGAAGLWIRKGELAEPVSEINVSGRLQEMLQSIDMVGDDVEWHGQVAAPTIRMAQLTVSGT